MDGSDTTITGVRIITHPGGDQPDTVTATGMDTEVGNIAEMMKTTETSKTPMQKRVDKLSHNLIGLSIAVVAVIIGFGIIIGQNWMEMMQTGLSLAVAAIRTTYNCNYSADSWR